MSLQLRIQQHFQQGTDKLREAHDMLANPIAEAAEALAGALLRGGRILACGNGGGAALSQYFVQALVSRFIRERPGLPAICLSANATQLTGLYQNHDSASVYAQQIRTLSQPLDVLVIFGGDAEAANLREAITAANDRSLTVILLSGEQSAGLAEVLNSESYEIRAPSRHSHRCFEIQVFICHCLCDLIDIQIFGEEL